MFGMDKIRQLQQMAQDPQNSEVAQSVASILAHYEHDLLGAVEDLHRALGMEDPLTVDQTPEDRVEKLLKLAEVAAGGEFETYWFGDVAGFENPETVASFAGLSEDEWADQMDNWAADYRQKAPEEFADQSDREVVAWHVEETYGVPLAEWEREVVGYSRRGALRAALGGNIAAGIDGVRRATQHARSETGVASDSSQSATSVDDGAEDGGGGE